MIPYHLLLQQCPYTHRGYFQDHEWLPAAADSTDFVLCKHREKDSDCQYHEFIPLHEKERKYIYRVLFFPWVKEKVLDDFLYGNIFQVSRLLENSTNRKFILLMYSLLQDFLEGGTLLLKKQLLKLPCF